MADFLVEVYVPRAGDGVEHAAQRARADVAEQSSERRAVRFLQAIFVPEDETCLLMFDAPSREAMEEAVRRGALRVDRITEAVSA